MPIPSSHFTQYASSARVFKAFSDEKRLAILSLLQGGEHCVCQLAEQLSIAQSALSYHLKILLSAGIVQARQEGKWTYYSINQLRRTQIADHLMTITEPLTLSSSSISCGSMEACATASSDSLDDATP